MATVSAAYPFIDVLIDTAALQPVAQRSPGVIAVCGASASGSAAVNTPTPVDTLADAVKMFGDSELTRSLALAFLQDPRPSKIYGVKIGGGAADADIKSALESLTGVSDVGFVSLAGITDPKLLIHLKNHVEQSSAAGQKRLGVAQIDPKRARSATYVADAVAAVHPTTAGQPDLLSSASRMILVAARGAALSDGATAADTATAAMAAIAGFPPSTSIVLKRVRGISIPLADQYNATEIKGLSEANIVPIIQPAMVVGAGFHFAEGRAFTSDATQLYIDIVRTLDDIDFRLKAGLIGLVGDARITRAGLTTLRTAVQGILGPLERVAVIDAFDVRIPLLDILELPESARTPTETSLVTTARANRTVDLLVSITYGPAVHRLRVTLQPKF
jgi:hypothetical protein